MENEEGEIKSTAKRVRVVMVSKGTEWGVCQQREYQGIEKAREKTQSEARSALRGQGDHPD